MTSPCGGGSRRGQGSPSVCIGSIPASGAGNVGQIRQGPAKNPHFATRPHGRVPVPREGFADSGPGGPSRRGHFHGHDETLSKQARIVGPGRDHRHSWRQALAEAGDERFVPVRQSMQVCPQCGQLSLEGSQCFRRQLAWCNGAVGHPASCLRIRGNPEAHIGPQLLKPMGSVIEPDAQE